MKRQQGQHPSWATAQNSSPSVTTPVVVALTLLLQNPPRCHLECLFPESVTMETVNSRESKILAPLSRAESGLSGPVDPLKPAGVIHCSRGKAAEQQDKASVTQLLLTSVVPGNCTLGQ